MSEHTPTVDEVEAQYGPTDIPTTADSEEDISDAEQLIEAAERMDDEIFGRNVLFTSTSRGNPKDRIILLACHRWALREGQPDSESQAGGSVSWNTVTGEWVNSLSQTKWGQEYRSYLQDQPNVSIF